MRTSLALAVLLVSSAHAAKDPAEAQARAKFQEAQKAYDVGQFKEALDLYTEAYKIKALPGFLFNIAQCHRQMHHWERAGFFYRRYLDLSPTAPPNEKQVKDFITEMEENQKEADAKRQQDQEEAKRLELAKLEAQKAEAEEKARREAQASSAVAAVPPTSPVAPAGAVDLNAAPAEPGAEPLYRKWWLWAGVGAAVIAGSAAVYMNYFNPRPTTLGNQCERTACP